MSDEHFDSAHCIQMARMLTVKMRASGVLVVLESW